MRAILEAVMRRRAETLQLPMPKITHRIAKKVAKMDWLAASDSNLLGGFTLWDFPALNHEEQNVFRDLTREWTDHCDSSTNLTIAKTRIAMQEGKLVPVVLETQLCTVVIQFELFTNVCWGDTQCRHRTLDGV